MTLIVSSETPNGRYRPIQGLKRRETMSKPPVVAAREQVRSFAPKLIDLTEKVVYGDVWERPGLSKRDRSLITCAALVAMNRTEQLRGHVTRAIDNGVTQAELVELITHLAFYSGWPTAMSAANVAKDVLEKGEKK
jgi:4-carboxymuconolactone decarboxylase